MNKIGWCFIQKSQTHSGLDNKAIRKQSDFHIFIQAGNWDQKCCYFPVPRLFLNMVLYLWLNSPASQRWVLTFCLANLLSSSWKVDPHRLQNIYVSLVNNTFIMCLLSRQKKNSWHCYITDFRCRFYRGDKEIRQATENKQAVFTSPRWKYQFSRERL